MFPIGNSISREDKVGFLRMKVKELEVKVEQLECDHPIDWRVLNYSNQDIFYTEQCNRCDKVLDKVFAHDARASETLPEAKLSRQMQITEQQLKELRAKRNPEAVDGTVTS